MLKINSLAIIKTQSQIFASHTQKIHKSKSDNNKKIIQKSKCFCCFQTTQKTTTLVVLLAWMVWKMKNLLRLLVKTITLTVSGKFCWYFFRPFLLTLEMFRKYNINFFMFVINQTKFSDVQCVTVLCTARISTLRKMDFCSARTIIGVSLVNVVRSVARLWVDLQWSPVTIDFILNVFVVKSVEMLSVMVIPLHWSRDHSCIVEVATRDKFHRLEYNKRQLPSSKNHRTLSDLLKSPGGMKTKIQFVCQSTKNHQVVRAAHVVAVLGSQSECFPHFLSSLSRLTFELTKKWIFLSCVLFF